MATRTSKSVLARHYTDFSPEKLEEIYRRAKLEILEGINKTCSIITRDSD